MQIKTTVRYHTTIRTDKVKTKQKSLTHTKTKQKNLTVDSVSKNTKHPGLSNTAEGNAMWYYHFGKVWWFLIKLNMHLVYQPAILCLGIYARKKKTCLYKTCRQTILGDDS